MSNKKAIFIEQYDNGSWYFIETDLGDRQGTLISVRSFRKMERIMKEYQKLQDKLCSLYNTTSDQNEE